MTVEEIDDTDEIQHNDFCFTHDGFIEYQSSMNDETRH